MLGEDLGSLLGHIDIGHRQKVRQRLEDSHLGPQAAPDATHFETDDPCTDDRELLWHGLQIKRTGVIANHHIIHGHPRQVARLGAGGNDHLFRDNNFLTDLDLPATVFRRANKGAVTVEQGNLVLLEQSLDAPGELGNDAVLAPDHRRHVDFRRTDSDTLRGKTVRGLGEEVRGMQKGFGRNAADIEAGTAEARLPLGIGIRIGFAAGDREAELRGADRCHIATGTTADDEHIKIFGHVMNLFGHSAHRGTEDTEKRKTPYSPWLCVLPVACV